MVEGVGRSGGLPEPIDGQTGGEGADGAKADASKPPSATPRGPVNSRLGGLIPDEATSASTPRSSSFRSKSDEEPQPPSDELLLAAPWLAYEQSAAVNEQAASVCNLEGVIAVLGQEGVAGPPPPPHDTPDWMPRFIGGPQLEGRERPKPLSTLAIRISSDEFLATERFEALMLVLDAIGKVGFKRHRVEPLAEMAEATSSVVDDAARTKLYRAVLQAAQGLWEERKAAQDKKSEITSGEFVHILESLSANFGELRVDAGSTRAALLKAVDDEHLFPDERRVALRGLPD